MQEFMSIAVPPSRKRLFSVKIGILVIKPEIFQAFVSEEIEPAERRKAR